MVETSSSQFLRLLKTLRAVYPGVFLAAVVAYDDGGRSPLHTLCAKPQNVELPTLYQLAELFLDPSVLRVHDQNGYLPLHYAASHQAGAVLIDLLSQAGVRSRNDTEWDVLPAIARTDFRNLTPWAHAQRHPAVKAALQEWIESTYNGAALKSVYELLAIDPSTQPVEQKKNS